MPGACEQEGTASKDLCHSEFDIFLICNFYFNRKLEKKSISWICPQLEKASRGGQCSYCALNPAKKMFIRAEDSNSTPNHGVSTFLD